MYIRTMVPPAGVALLADQLEDHFAVPDVIGQQLIDDRLVEIQLFFSWLGRPKAESRFLSTAR